MAARATFASRLGAIFALILLLAVAPPTAALADGDPASDVLLGENVFYPYSPAVSPAVQKKLDAATAAAKRANFPLKVALIASPVDLGVIPDLFGKPQQYANFLDQEISFQGGKQPLLVVMSTGYGVQGIDGKASSAAATLAKPAGGHSDALATAAITAVTKLADAAGHPLKGGAGGSQSSGSGAGVIVALIAAAALTAAALAAVMIRRRHASASG